MLVTLDLSRMGVSKSNQPPANWAGGINATDKELNETDSDLVKPRLERRVVAGPRLVLVFHVVLLVFIADLYLFAFHLAVDLEQ